MPPTSAPVGGCPQPRTLTVGDREYVVPCASRYCPRCGVLWAADQRVVAVAASEWIGGDVGLFTVTAPGSWWIGSRAQALGLPVEQVKRWWNMQARAAWRRLHLAASRPMRAWARIHAPEWRLLFRAWEYQQRGMLHAHVVVPMRTPAERRVSRLYLANLWSCARDERFGFVLGGHTHERPSYFRAPTAKRFTGAQAALYLAKYVAKAAPGRSSLSDTVKRTALRGSVLYVSRTLSVATGVTMTGLKARRRIHSRWSWAASSESSWRTACLLDAVQRGRPPLSPDAVRLIREHPGVAGARGWFDPADAALHEPTSAPPARGALGRTYRSTPRGRPVGLRLASVEFRDPTSPRGRSLRTVAEVVR